MLKSNYKLILNETFEEPQLNEQVWIPYYLSHWSSREKTKARYELKDGLLHLKIDHNQEPWSKEFNGDIRVSSFQTGIFSGPLNSKIGQHRVHPTCVVREEQVSERKFLMHHGYIEIRAKASAHPTNVSALWMIGFEDKPENSSELCIVEIKGWNIESNKAIIGYGIRKFQDPKLKDEFYEDPFELDVTEFHTYGAEWSPEKVTFFLDGKVIRTINQSPDYPMQMMLNIYEIPKAEKTRNPEHYPQEFIVDYIRVFDLKNSNN
ncbi:glycoside hydrolase family 16 protein [Algoriphagus lacus]|uniref:glycoside hydrolase family 16 protein n=1 Tax=Algoriphagus lacus TaxID=2056311 RepID=UPI0018F5107D|nr:glycoside hydrolase family 16 protein [Algoriphagus lacus]